MYSLPEYARMIADPIRMGAHVKALKQKLKPGDIVLDLGAGFGFFAVLACRLGARKAYAIEPSEVIRLGPEFASANGCARRVEFIQKLSTKASLPEKVDLIICDLRGMLPLLRENLFSIKDACERLLAPGGVLIPHRDTMWVALAEAPELYEQSILSLTAEFFSLNLSPLRRFLVNSFEVGRFERDQLLAEPQVWGVVDYQNIVSMDFESEVNFRIERRGVAHGVSLWFEAELAPEVGYTNAPFAPKTVHGTPFLFFESPLELENGDLVQVRLKAKSTPERYLWFWETKVFSQGNRAKITANFHQSNFLGDIPSPTDFRRQAVGHVPKLDEDGRIARLVLSEMNGEASLQQIAHLVCAQFPQRFPTWLDALSKVTEVSRKHSEF